VSTPWWKTAVIYQIYPRSFADSNRDGVGDLPGITARLDHLASLGVDALWLSPIYRSPMADFGYDISDHCDIDPLFGSLTDLDALVDAAHQRNLRVLLDMVPNHTSDEHPWFIASRSSRQDPKRDWYVWRDPAPDGGPPNNWIRAWGGEPAWTFDEATGQYYLHLFLDKQPDLDWTNPEVVAAMHDVMRFWFDRGIDGFRIDVVHAIGKDPDLPDDDPSLLPIPHCALNHYPQVTHPLLRDLRSLADAYEHQPVLLGEVFLLDTSTIAEYHGDNDELHLCFNFPAMHGPWRAGAWRRHLERTAADYDPRQAWPTWVLSNHDAPRHRTRFGERETTARAAAVLLLGLRGTPVLYAGEELGLSDAVVAPDRQVDPGGRDGCRAPMPWTAEPGHGWGTTEPWLPWPPQAATRNVATQAADPDSVLALYRRLLASRAATPALTLGDQEVLAGTADGVLAWRRTPPPDAGADSATMVIAVNFTGDPLPADGLPAGTVVLSSDGAGEGGAVPGMLGADQALVIAESPPGT
jgi:alpha-glucosidase